MPTENQAPEGAPAPDDWQHLKPYGYAPGGYMSRCRKCGATPTMDKRATACRPCAEAMHAAALASQPAEQRSQFCPICEARGRADASPAEGDTRKLVEIAYEMGKRGAAIDELERELALASDVQPKGTAPDLYVGLIERLMALSTRLGIAYEGGVEHFGASLEDRLYAICRGIERLLDSLNATQSPAPAPDVDGGDLPCPRCNGSGFELQWSDNSPDAHQVEVNCDHCDGAGSLGAAYTHLSQVLKRERERNKAAGNELHWLKSGPFFGLRADKSIQTAADRLDELADACGKYDPRSERASDIRAAATAWRKHLAGPTQAPAVKAEPTVREFTNELGNAIRITIEGPNSTSENVLTPMEGAELRDALNQHAAHAEFEVWEGDELFAGTSGPRVEAWAELLRYAAQCEGVVRVFEVRRVERTLTDSLVPVQGSKP